MDLQNEMLEAFLNEGEGPLKVVYAQLVNGFVEICYDDGYERLVRKVELLDLLGFVWGAAK